jgi:hypothetical protein
MTKIMIAPKNCPFCNSSDVGGSGGQVHCYSCPAKMEVQNTNTFYAVELWNNRPSDSKIALLQAQVAQLQLLVVEAYESGYYDGAGDDLWYADHDSPGGELTETASILRPMKEFLDTVYNNM